MIIRTLTADEAVAQLQSWHGERPAPKQSEAERVFRSSCREYTLVELQNRKELLRLGRMEEYLTENKGFFLYLRCPQEVLREVDAGKVRFPAFLQKAEELYSCEVTHGNVQLLFGALLEELDRQNDMDLFIELLARESGQQTGAEKTGPKKKASPKKKAQPKQKTQPKQQAAYTPAPEPEPAAPRPRRPRYTVGGYMGNQGYVSYDTDEGYDDYDYSGYGGAGGNLGYGPGVRVYHYENG